MALRKSFPNRCLLKLDSLCLTLLILSGMIKSKFFSKVVIPILKYGIAILLGYIGGENMPTIF